MPFLKRSLSQIFAFSHFMENIRVTTVQTNLHWENIEANLAMFDEKLQGLVGQTDLVVLPEMFTTGFSMNAAGLAESMDGRTMKWLKEQAIRTDAAVMGSFIVRENDLFYNRLVFMLPNGVFEYYDKRHLFTLAKEHEAYQAGTKKLIVGYKGWRICPMVCYDLRFPVWSRNNDEYDLLIYVANWPNKRSYHWRQLLVGRAIENQSFVIGVNRTGLDEKGLGYSGDSAVIDYSGRILYQMTDQEDVFTCSLNMEQVKSFREKLTFLDDREKFEIFI